MVGPLDIMDYDVLSIIPYVNYGNHPRFYINSFYNIITMNFWLHLKKNTQYEYYYDLLPTSEYLY
jgi:hypothetical protein